MRPGAFRILPFALLIAIPTAVLAQERLAKSPDGRLRAKTITLRQNCAEDRLMILNQNDVVIYSQDFSSSDCAHGTVILRTGWTPDSRFFVFNVESSAGHQLGHYPVLFYSRRDNRLYHLENFIGYTVAPEFGLKTPDIVTTEKQKTKGEFQGTPIEVSLGRIVRRRRSTS